MTRKEMILEMFTDNQIELSCQQITNTIIKAQKLEDNKARYLSGSISSILHTLVHKNKILYYSNNKTFKGGHKYKKVIL